LRPLDTVDHDGKTEYRTETGTRKFDKLLFVNDVVFSPKDAMDLLFATNISPDGQTQYQAACAMDFINPVKFYDTFATRDSEAYRLGVPFFPWFTRAGQAGSRHDVLRGTDAVRVKSCWGGMVAFEAKWFQQHQLDEKTRPLRFRYEMGLFWDASECCLIHADLEDLANKGGAVGTRIYVNPFIRVAYDAKTFGWLEFSRRFERLYTIPHTIVNWLVNMPFPSLRRLELPGELVSRREWMYDGPGDEIDGPSEDLSRVSEFGHWEIVQTIASPGGFCGYQQLFVLRKKRLPGQKMWEVIDPPSRA
jgi:hypothetical protein